VCCLNNLYYVVLMAWSMAYLFMSFITPLPWVKTTILTSEERSKSSGEELATSFFNKDFFSKKMLESTDNIEE
jgi:SNF family Na+-dependent transporter